MGMSSAVGATGVWRKELKPHLVPARHSAGAPLPTTCCLRLSLSLSFYSVQTTTSLQSLLSCLLRLTQTTTRLLLNSKASRVLEQQR
jgi:hypothetical protein